MEVNTVVLSLPEYNALREFRENIEKGNSYRVLAYYEGYCGRTDTNLYISTDEAVKHIAEKNKSLEKLVDELNQRIYDIEHPSTKEVTISQVKRMSVWQFLRWRKK